MHWDQERLKYQPGLLQGWGQALGRRQSLAGWWGGDARRVPAFRGRADTVMGSRGPCQASPGRFEAPLSLAGQAKVTSCWCVGARTEAYTSAGVGAGAGCGLMGLAAVIGVIKVFL